MSLRVNIAACMVGMGCHLLGGVRGGERQSIITYTDIGHPFGYLHCKVSHGQQCCLYGWYANEWGDTCWVGETSRKVHAI